MKAVKQFIYRLLCNTFTGTIIYLIFKNRIPDIRWKGFSFSAGEDVSKEMIAAIFFGFYESAEIRLVKKFLHPDLDVIELGASLGVVSGHIAKKLSSATKFIMVEANPKLIPIIKNNIERYTSKKSFYRILNYAISYGTETVSLDVTGNNTESFVIKDKAKTSSALNIKTATLSSIINEFQIEEYALVCDIEGSEIEWLLNESISLQRCRQLLIELHKVTYPQKYSTADLKEIILTKHNFKLVESSGPVCYFEK